MCPPPYLHTPTLLSERADVYFLPASSSVRTEPSRRGFAPLPLRFICSPICSFPLKRKLKSPPPTHTPRHMQTLHTHVAHGCEQTNVCCAKAHERAQICRPTFASPSFYPLSSPPPPLILLCSCECGGAVFCFLHRVTSPLSQSPGLKTHLKPPFRRVSHTQPFSFSAQFPLFRQNLPPTNYPTHIKSTFRRVRLPPLLPVHGLLLRVRWCHFQTPLGQDV